MAISRRWSSSRALPKSTMTRRSGSWTRRAPRAARTSASSSSRPSNPSRNRVSALTNGGLAAAVRRINSHLSLLSLMRVDHTRALHAIASLSVFASSYAATVALVAHLLRMAGLLALGQWAWLTGGVVATLLTISVCEGGRWRIGLQAPARIAVRELLLGAALAAVLVLAADGLVLATTALRHARGSGFSWLELIAVYAPAAIHEELVFRGYPLQKLRTLSRPVAIGVTSLVFAAMHGANNGLTAVAFANLLLAGVLLALAYERYGRLWFPIGLHLAWNLLCGPILGYDVSGYVPERSVLTTRGKGAPLLTGGIFGIEGRIWIVLVEVAGIAFLYLRQRHRQSVVS